ncbi:MAG: hypothetical protein FWC77_08330, partial [Defluviitaleaceae bacterium]|nr:hypothetical protein [Defluviitaleaceae bacterium]
FPPLCVDFFLLALWASGENVSLIGENLPRQFDIASYEHSFLFWSDIEAALMEISLYDFILQPMKRGCIT